MDVKVRDCRSECRQIPSATSDYELHERALASEWVGASKNNLLSERRHGPPEISVIWPIYGMPVQKGISHLFGEKRQLETPSSSQQRRRRPNTVVGWSTRSRQWRWRARPQDARPAMRQPPPEALPRAVASEPAAYTNRSADAQCARPASGTRVRVYNTLDQRPLAGCSSSTTERALFDKVSLYA